MTGLRTLPAIAAIALALFTLLQIPAAQAKGMVSVDRPEVNMRTGAGTGHEVIWVLARGYPLMVVGQQGKWLKVRDFENDEGWVYRTLTGRKPHMVVKAKVANIRSAPTTRSRIVGKAEYGEVLRTLESRSGWTKIRNETGLVGWVSRKLLWGW